MADHGAVVAAHTITVALASSPRRKNGVSTTFPRPLSPKPGRPPRKREGRKGRPKFVMTKNECIYYEGYKNPAHPLPIRKLALRSVAIATHNTTRLHSLSPQEQEPPPRQTVHTPKNKKTHYYKATDVKESSFADTHTRKRERDRNDENRRTRKHENQKNPYSTAQHVEREKHRAD